MNLTSKVFISYKTQVCSWWKPSRPNVLQFPLVIATWTAHYTSYRVYVLMCWCPNMHTCYITAQIHVHYDVLCAQTTSIRKCFWWLHIKLAASLVCLKGRSLVLPSIVIRKRIRLESLNAPGDHNRRTDVDPEEVQYCALPFSSSAGRTLFTCTVSTPS